MADIKTHLVGARKVLFSYMLALLLSWGSYPLIAIVLSGYGSPDLRLCIFSVFSTLVLCIITYLMMHGYGENDIKPYKWARYKAKGLVCGLIAMAIVLIVEYIMIIVAREYLVVTHPLFVIETLNAYVRMAAMMPFYWLFRLLEGTVGAVCPVPSVTFANALLPVIIVSAVATFGYFMGYTGRRIFHIEISEGKLHDILYPKPKRVRQEEKERRRAARKQVNDGEK